MPTISDKPMLMHICNVLALMPASKSHNTQAISCWVICLGLLTDA